MVSMSEGAESQVRVENACGGSASIVEDLFVVGAHECWVIFHCPGAHQHRQSYCRHLLRLGFGRRGRDKRLSKVS